MYERFTDRARIVMQLANQEAQRVNHERIGPEHILAGILREGNGVAANVLKNLGRKSEEFPELGGNFLLRMVRDRYGPVPTTGTTVVMGRLPHTPTARKATENAVQAARDLNHNYVGTEHLLLGLLGTPDNDTGLATDAGAVLREAGLTFDAVRAEVVRLLSVGTAKGESPKPVTVPAGSVPAKFGPNFEVIPLVFPERTAQGATVYRYDPRQPGAMERAAYLTGKDPRGGYIRALSEEEQATIDGEPFHREIGKLYFTPSPVAVPSVAFGPGPEWAKTDGRSVTIGAFVPLSVAGPHGAAVGVDPAQPGADRTAKTTLPPLPVVPPGWQVTQKSYTVSRDGMAMSMSMEMRKRVVAGDSLTVESGPAVNPPGEHIHDPVTGGMFATNILDAQSSEPNGCSADILAAQALLPRWMGHDATVFEHFEACRIGRFRGVTGAVALAKLAVKLCEERNQFKAELMAHIERTPGHKPFTPEQAAESNRAILKQIDTLVAVEDVQKPTVDPWAVNPDAPKSNIIQADLNEAARAIVSMGEPVEVGPWEWDHSQGAGPNEMTAVEWFLKAAINAGEFLVFNYPRGDDTAKRNAETCASKIKGKVAVVMPRDHSETWAAVEQYLFVSRVDHQAVQDAKARVATVADETQWHVTPANQVIWTFDRPTIAGDYHIRFHPTPAAEYTRDVCRLRIGASGAGYVLFFDLHSEVPLDSIPADREWLLIRAK